MEKKSFLLVAACFAGNMGGDAMYESLIAGIKADNPEHRIVVLTKYPKDEISICKERGYEVYSYTTIERALKGIPFSIFGTILKKCHLPNRWIAGKALKQYFQCDVLIDCSGISFTDFRSRLDLFINTSWLVPAFVTGIPVIKISQSLGPYENKQVRKAALKYFPKINYIIARGDESYECTKKLIPNHSGLYNLPDLAFNLPVAQEEKRIEILEDAGAAECINNPYFVAAPSFEVDRRMGSEVYRSLFAAVVRAAHKILPDMPIVMLAHTRALSAAVGVDSGNDDMTVCRAVADMLSKEGISVHLIEKKYYSKELKAVISGARFAIGSRYHFLMAAMSTATPSLAMGWGHKYKEMFHELDFDEFAFEYHDFKADILCKRVGDLAMNYEKYSERISGRLPDVKARAAKQIELALELAKEGHE